MKLRIVNIAIFASLCAVAGYSQEIPDRKVAALKHKLGIINGMASYLPRPEYSKEARDFCAKGKVEVEVVIDADGKVVSANAISGDELLYEASVVAAKRAKISLHAHLRKRSFKGMLVYNFAGVVRCIISGVVNGKALKRPQPIPNHNFHLTKPVKVLVRVMINADGKVDRVWTNKSIDPAIRAAAEKLARTTTFSTVAHMPRDIFVSASLEYTFKPGGKIEY